MGQLVVQEFVSADGFAADANNEFTFHELLDGGTAEFDRSQLEWLDTVGAMVLGANTYRMFAEFWPTPASKDEIIAPALNRLRRVVFSRQLTTAPWGDMPEATIESGDAIEAIRRIRRFRCSAPNRPMAMRAATLASTSTPYCVFSWSHVPIRRAALA